MVDTMLEVSFVISSRNEPPDLLRHTVKRLQATAATVPYEIIVVDDASEPPVAVDPHERVTVVRNAVQLGTMSSCRRGCERASGRVLVVLDAHMSFADDWLDPYLAAVEPRTLVCPNAWDYGLTRSLYFGADLFWRGGVRWVWWGYHWRTRRPRGRTPDVPMVLGACYGLERESYEHLGGFSPHYRVWGLVEQDLSYRAWMSGFRVRCATRAKVGHFYRRGRPPGTEVSADNFRYNQLLFGHCQLEEELAAALLPFVDPPPAHLERLRSPEVVAWRELVQSRRQRSDRELHRGPLRELSRTLPVTLGETIRYRPGRLPTSVLAARAHQEERRVAGGLPVLGDDAFDAWHRSPLPAPGDTTRVPGGVVTDGDRTLLLVGGYDGSVPALQLELLRAGAALHSAGEACLDEAGRALAQATPLRLDGAELLPESVGSSFSGGSRPIDWVAFVTYEPGARWRVAELTEGAAVLALLARCKVAIGEPPRNLKRLRAAVAGARTIEIRRGSARVAAKRLLGLLRADRPGPPAELDFVHYGTPVAIELEDPRWRRRLRAALPTGAVLQTTDRPQARFRVERVSARGLRYRLRRDGGRIVGRAPTLWALAADLASKLEFAVARLAEEFLFVHAGAVAVGDRAILLPGRSGSGKTTLVRALVAAGARYLSDEFAVIDGRGGVWPYPKPLNLRNGGGTVARVPVEELGGQQRFRPARVGLVVHTHFDPEADWAPEKISPGSAYLALMENTVRAQERPAATLERATSLANAALCLQGPRPEAERVARDLIARLEAEEPRGSTSFE